jgi:sugar lactone lactonase YvrE
MRRWPIFLLAAAATATALEGAVYFERAGHLYHMEADGAAVELVDELFGYTDLGVTLTSSPDGAVLVLAADAAGGWDLYRYDFAAGEPVPLYDSGWWDGLPALSPDGQRVACASLGDGSEIVLFDLDDPAGVRRLTELEEWARWPVWSPDGRTLYFIHAAIGADYSELMYLELPDGEPQVLETFRGEVKEFAPAPDGSLFALTFRPAALESFDIFLYDAHSGEFDRLTGRPEDCGGPCFAGDRRSIYYHVEYPLEYPTDEYGYQYEDDHYEPGHRHNPEKSLPEDADDAAVDEDEENAPDDVAAPDTEYDPLGWLPSYRNTIHLLDLETGEDVELTTGEEPCWYGG